MKKIYKVDGMDCVSCATMIELDLEDAGIKAKCSYAKQKLEVEYDPKVIDHTKISEVVTKSGYSLSRLQ